MVFFGLPTKACNEVAGKSHSYRREEEIRKNKKATEGNVLHKPGSKFHPPGTILLILFTSWR